MLYPGFIKPEEVTTQGLLYLCLMDELVKALALLRYSEEGKLFRVPNAIGRIWRGVRAKTRKAAPSMVTGPSYASYHTSIGASEGGCSAVGLEDEAEATPNREAPIWASDPS